MRTLTLRPLVSEKPLAMQAKGVYAFLTSKDAGKISIKKEIEALYKVRVVAVRTLVQPSKRKARATKRGVIEGRKTGYKKVYVQLAEGDAIDFYASISK